MLRLAATLLFAAAVCVFLFVAHACLVPDPPRPNPDPLRRSGAENVELRVLIGWPVGALGVSFQGEARVTVEGSGAAAADLSPGAHAASLDGSAIRLGARRFEAASIRIEFTAGRFTLEGKDASGKPRSTAYRGHLGLHRAGASLLVVNVVMLDDYLLGVVGREMSLQPGLTEALKAQVIAARTYALYERDLPREGPFDLYDDERSQAYGGVAAETELAKEVVDTTRGLVVLYLNRVVPTFYSSTCGGETEPAWEMLDNVEKLPPLRGATCGHCSASPHYEWSSRLSRAAMAEAVFGRPGIVEEVRVERRAKGGHALEVVVRLRGAAEGVRLEANRGFRHKLGTRVLRSTLITEIKGAGTDAFEIRGRGWGHGAGMCQWGAYGMARTGRSAHEILEHYFPGALVTRRY